MIYFQHSYSFMISGLGSSFEGVFVNNCNVLKPLQRHGRKIKDLGFRARIAVRNLDALLVRTLLNSMCHTVNAVKINNAVN